jgi:low affinity Fe/Cu permease
MDMITGAVIATIWCLTGGLMVNHINNKDNADRDAIVGKEIRKLMDTINNQEVQIELLKEQLIEAKEQTPESSTSDIFRIKHGAKKGLLSYKKLSER